MSGASNSDVQYVAYLKAKFNLADADLLQVISLSQRPTSQELADAPEGEEIEEVIEEDDDEEEKVEMVDASAYEEVIDEESYEESYEEEEEEAVEEEEVEEEEVEEVEASEEEVMEYVDESATPSPAPAPVPAPYPVSDTAREAEDGTSPVDSDPPVEETIESPSSQLEYSAATATPDEEILEAPAPATSQAIVPVEDAPDDEVEDDEQQIVESKEEEVVPSVRHPEPVEPDPVEQAESPAPSDEVPSLTPFSGGGDLQKVPNTEPPADDPNKLAIVPAKPQALVPIPEQAPPMDEEEAVPAVKQPEETIYNTGEPQQDKSKQLAVIACFLLLLIIVAVLLILYFTGVFGGDDDSGPTTMAGYVSGNCDFSGQAQPNVISQCECTGSVSVVDDWTRQQYERLSTEFIVPTIYSSWVYTIESCEPANKALLWLSTGPVIEDQTILTQRYTMAYLYYSTEGQKWTNQFRWVTQSDVCTWHGLSCVGPEIERIELSSNRVNGQIPTELAKLNQLSTIAFNQNLLQKTIPPNVFSIRNLRTLQLGINLLTGTIPPQIGQALGLQTLELNNNALDRSPIPSDLNRLTNLVSLQLQGNPFTGRIASEYGLFRNLETLDLSNTELHSRLPNEYEALTRLQEMRIAKTDVGGVIPTYLRTLTSLRVVDFTGSQFRQGIPPHLGLLTSLSTLMLGENEFTGAVPSELGRLTRLSLLELHDNFLTGLVPTHLGLLRDLTNFTMQGNRYLTGRMPEEICALRGTSTGFSSRGNLEMFTVDCPTREYGVLCPIPTCCTECFELLVGQPET